MEQQECRYRLLLRSIVKPIGAPDTRKSNCCSPEELQKHVKSVFGISDTKHQHLLAKEQLDKPVVLKVSNIAAKIIKNNDQNANINPYCIVGLVTPADKTRTTFYVEGSDKKNKIIEVKKFSSLPRVFNSDSIEISSSLHQRNGSSGLDVTQKTRKVSFDQVEVKRTSAVIDTFDPVWNEDIEIDVTDVLKEEIQVYIWDSKDEKKVDGVGQDLSSKASGFMNLLKVVKQSLDYSHPFEDMIGYFSLPVRDVPSAGCEQWFPLYSKKKGGAPVCGKLHLTLVLGTKQENSSDHSDEVDSNHCSLEDYYNIVKSFHMYSAQCKKNEETRFYNGILPTESHVVLRHLSAHNRISKFSQSVVHCSILMEWNHARYMDVTSMTVSTSAVISALKKLHDDIRWSSDWEIVDRIYKDVDDVSGLNEFEVDLFDQAACWFIQYYLTSEDGMNETFFPICSSKVKGKLDVLDLLIKLELTCKHQNYKKTIIDHLTSKVQRDVYVAIDKMMDTFVIQERDGELKLTRNLTSLITESVKICQDAPHHNVLFTNLNFNYASTLAVAVDEKICKISQTVIKKIDEYLNKYQRYEVNVKDGSRASIGLYFSLRHISQVLNDIIKTSSMDSVITSLSAQNKSVELTILNYVSWFHIHFQFWMQTFRSECLGRTERAVIIDSCPTQVIEGSEISVSCVDVLSCYTQVCQEWKRIDINEPDLKLIGITKLTDAICDAARQYVRQLLHASTDILDCDSADCIKTQCCLFINNMEHIRQYLPTLPEVLDWELIIDHATESKDENLKEQTLKTLSRLLKCAEKDIREHLDMMLTRIAAFLSRNIKSCLQRWTDPLNQTRDVDILLRTLDNNLQILHTHLKSAIFTPLLMELWKVILQKLNRYLVFGETPEYTESILTNLEMVREYFVDLGLSDKEIQNNYVYHSLSKNLVNNSKSTIDLQLQYYKEMADSVSTPVDYNGHLSVKFGYSEETLGKVTIYIYVLRAIRLPGLDQNGFSDPFVSIELFPKPIFSTFAKQKTKVIRATLNPVFNQLFLIPDVPTASMKMKGSVLRLAVKDYDKIGTNDFAGEVFLNLSQASDMSKIVSIDFIPALMLPLKRPYEMEGPFEVLKVRRKWDKEAKIFYNKRMVAIGNQRERTDSKNGRSLTTNIFKF
ncbi:Uncharacterised protein g7652 [Pycnogonum litorale]